MSLYSLRILKIFFLQWKRQGLQLSNQMLPVFQEIFASDIQCLVRVPVLWCH